MRTIAQALKDEIHYPLNDGFIANKLLKRGLSGSDEITAEVINGDAFKGATADCLYSLIAGVNFSESDISISLNDKNLILKQVNAIYASIGEEEKELDQPRVWIGWA